MNEVTLSLKGPKRKGVRDLKLDTRKSEAQLTLRKSKTLDSCKEVLVSVGEE